MNFKQCICRALDRAGFTQAAQQTAHERGFARAKIAVQPDYQPGGETLGVCKACAEAQCRRFIGQRKPAC